VTAAIKPLPGHGTPSRAKGRPAAGIPRCPCPRCRTAQRAYDKRRRVLNATGRSLRVPVEPVAAHLDALFAAGAGWVQLATLAQVSQSSLSKIRNRRQAAIRRTVADRILAIPPGRGIPARRNVPAAGAIRRVHALMAIGHTLAAIGAAAHLNHTVMNGLVNGYPATVWASTHASIADAYQALATQPGSNTRALRRAERNAWHDPDFWDDTGRIDDPAFDPDKPLSRNELGALRRDEILHLARCGLQPETIRERLNEEISLSHVRNTVTEYRAGVKRDRRSKAAA